MIKAKILNVLSIVIIAAFFNAKVGLSAQFESQTVATQASVEDMERTINDALALITECSTKSTLLETIRFCAEKSEVFPIYVFDYPSSWIFHYENTFSRYLPFYLFKTKVGTSTRQDLEECIVKLDELNSKEKAYALTAILIFERFKRKRSRTFYENRQRDMENCQSVFAKRREKGLYVPYYANLPFFSGRTDDVLYPPYNPDETIDDVTWSRWIDVVRAQTHNGEIAFPAFRADELAPKQEFPYRIGPNDSIHEMFGNVFVDCPLAREWLDNQQLCLYAVNKYLELEAPQLSGAMTPPTTAFSCCATLWIPFATEIIDEPAYSYIRDFLERTEYFESNATSERMFVLALRDYWFTFQVHSASLSSIGGDTNFCCNSSAYSRSLSEIAAYILNRRFFYYYNDDACKETIAPPKVYSFKRKISSSL